jgi:hypothetical protein
MKPGQQLGQTQLAAWAAVGALMDMITGKDRTTGAYFNISFRRETAGD